MRSIKHGALINICIDDVRQHIMSSIDIDFEQDLDKI